MDYLEEGILAEADGSLAIGNYVRVGQTVQFHVRDAETADEDLMIGWYRPPISRSMA